MSDSKTDKKENNKLFKRAVFLTAYSIVFFMIGLAIASWLSKS